MANNPSDNIVIPPPPRLTGDWQTDYAAMAQWMSDFYSAQTAPPPAFDPSNLPGPINTTIGLAQQTANIAYEYADKINQALGTAAVAGFPITPPTS